MDRTPEEIKKAMVYCVELYCPGEKCPYYHAESCAQDKTYDALALIQQLEDQVPRWISVEERLPDIDPDAVYSGYMYSQELFVFDGEQLAAAYYCHTTKQWHDSRYEDDILDVKYWAQPMPLPEAPKEEHE